MASNMTNASLPLIRTSVPPGDFVTISTGRLCHESAAGQFDGDVVQQPGTAEARGDQQSGRTERRHRFQCRSAQLKVFDVEGTHLVENSPSCIQDGCGTAGRSVCSG
jgi:hypothetical protein